MNNSYRCSSNNSESLSNINNFNNSNAVNTNGFYNNSAALGVAGLAANNYCNNTNTQNLASNNDFNASNMANTNNTCNNNAQNLLGTNTSNNQNVAGVNNCVNETLRDTLCNCIGRRCTCEFSTDDGLESKSGILERVGDDYLVLRSINNNRAMYCNITNLMFVTIMC